MAGSVLLRDGSIKWVYLKMWHGWTHHLPNRMTGSAVASCTCSSATTAIGSMKMHAAKTKAWPGFTWPSWHWNRGLKHWGDGLRKALIVWTFLSSKLTGGGVKTVNNTESQEIMTVAKVGIQFSHSLATVCLKLTTFLHLTQSYIKVLHRYLHGESCGPQL